VVLDDLALLVPPGDRASHHLHQSAVWWHFLEFFISSGLYLRKRLHEVELKIPLPRCEVFMAADGLRGDDHVCAGVEHASVVGGDTGFIKVEDPNADHNQRSRGLRQRSRTTFL